MAKAIYYLKMALVAHHTDLFHQNELREIHIMSEFVAVFFTPWWLKTFLSTKSPTVDYTAISTMKKYMVVNPEVAEPCLLSLGRHSWYLTEELVIMSLADEEVSADVRSKMAKQLAKTHRV